MKLKALIAASALFASAANAQDLTIEVTNLTHGIYFTPIVAAAHTSDAHIFRVGQAASDELKALAEGGAIDGVIGTLTGANTLANPAGGLLGPAAKASGDLMTDDGNMYLSVAAMILPTNDGFVGLDSWKIPSEAGTYTIYLNAYDAGTEANNELVVAGSGAPGVLGIPAAPGGQAGANGSGVTMEETNKTVHVHRGALGDDNATGGASDLNNTVHRWLNPVAKVTVTVK